MGYTRIVSEIFIKPKKGLRVLNPATMLPISEDGQKVSKNSYWTRRQLDGDITISEVAEKTLKKATQSKNKNKDSKEVNNDGNI